MSSEQLDYHDEREKISSVSEGAAAAFQNLTPEQAAMLVRQVVTETLPTVARVLRTYDPTRVYETLVRDTEGNVIVGDGEVVVSPLQMETLRRALHELPADTPVKVRQQLAAVTQALSDNLVPPADFACRAREYAARQQARRGPLDRAGTEEPLYVPLELRFHRAIRASGDDLFRQEERAYDDIQQAVEALDPASPSGTPFPALVLLGAPGAGKSTSLRHLGLTLLRAVLEDPAAHLPLFVNLSDYAGDNPADFLATQYRHWYGDDDLSAVLKAGRLWLLADGLNEMRAANERDYEACVQAWRRFFKEDYPPGNRALIACRQADYGTGLDLPRLEVEPIDDARIRAFIARRLGGAPTRGERLWQALLADLEARGPEYSLYGLARNPFWLVMLVDVYRDLGHLPENRAALVQQFVDHWLAYETDRTGRLLTDRQRAALQLALDRLAFAMLGDGQNAPQPREWVLSHLPDQVDVDGNLMPIDPPATLALAESACLLECRGRPEARVVRFYHQLLVDHFAGRELLRRFCSMLAKEGTDSLLPLDRPALWRIPWQEKWQFVESAWDPLPPPPTTGWEEATALAAARAALEDGDWARLAQAILVYHPPLAARCLLEAGTSPEEEVRREVADRLLSVIQDPAATAALEDRQRTSLRIACGLALGALGDPRILAGEREAVHPDGRRVRFIEPAWSQVIEAGPFLMGSSRDDPEAYDDEYSEVTGYRPHTIVVPYAYAVGLYPVTNAEYACFVQGGGYEDERWWDTDEARRWLWGELDLSGPWLRRWQQIAQWVQEGSLNPDELVTQQHISPDYAETLKWAAAASDEELAQAVRGAAGTTAAERHQPRFWEDRRHNNPSQPVVGVCWYEARAYCNWLTEQLRVTNYELGSVVRLPTEVEWEKAARWDGKRARRYPWGQKWDEAKANTLEGRVLTTTPVGIYPAGAASCSALDCAGNVREWSSSRWGPGVERSVFAYPSDPGDGREEPGGTDLRVVRGGSWNVGMRSARCACRYGYYPDYRYNDIGFRVLLQVS